VVHVPTRGMRDRASPVEPAPAAEPRRRHPVRAASDAEVLAAVIELSGSYRAPSTSLITWRLARGATITGAFQSAVRDALQHLRARGQLSCVVHRGTQRWSATRESDPPSP
jgi:hypothetical protein